MRGSDTHVQRYRALLRQSIEHQDDLIAQRRALDSQATMNQGVGNQLQA